MLAELQQTSSALPSLDRSNFSDDDLIAQQSSLDFESISNRWLKKSSQGLEGMEINLEELLQCAALTEDIYNKASKLGVYIEPQIHDGIDESFRILGWQLIDSQYDHSYVSANIVGARALTSILHFDVPISTPQLEKLVNFRKGLESAYKGNDLMSYWLKIDRVKGEQQLLNSMHLDALKDNSQDDLSPIGNIKWQPSGIDFKPSSEEIKLVNYLNQIPNLIIECLSYAAITDFDISKDSPEAWFSVKHDFLRYAEILLRDYKMSSSKLGLQIVDTKNIENLILKSLETLDQSADPIFDKMLPGHKRRLIDIKTSLSGNYIKINDLEMALEALDEAIQIHISLPLAHNPELTNLSLLGPKAILLFRLDRRDDANSVKELIDADFANCNGYIEKKAYREFLEEWNSLTN